MMRMIPKNVNRFSDKIMRRKNGLRSPLEKLP
jgi:hypothetical protein